MNLILGVDKNRRDTCAEIQLPGSKSVANRLLMLSAISGATPELVNLPDCDDVRVMLSAIKAIDSGEKIVDVRAAGTAMRFLTAYIATVDDVEIELTGTARMCERPVCPLVDALRELGADIEYLGNEGYPPLRIHGRTLCGGEVHIRAGESSQYISALMMAGCRMERGLCINISGNDFVSRPYIMMTERLMRQLGCDVRIDYKANKIHVANGLPVFDDSVVIESDWSAASYVYEWVSQAGGKVFIPNLVAPVSSLQGDSGIVEIFSGLGVHTDFSPDGATLIHDDNLLHDEFVADMRNMPDVVPTVVATCCMSKIRFRITGISGLRLKECDRVYGISTELRRLGYVIDVEDDVISWNGCEERNYSDDVMVRTYDDHRMAMSMTPFALHRDNIAIENADCVSKSWPCFWESMLKLGLLYKEIEK